MNWEQAPCPRCDDPGFLDKGGVWCGNANCKVNQMGMGPYQHPPGCGCDDEPCEDTFE